MSNDTDNSPVGVISTFSVEGLLIYSPNISGLTVWGVWLSLSSSLHTGITAARPRTCVTWRSKAKSGITVNHTSGTNKLSWIQYHDLLLQLTRAVTDVDILLIRCPHQSPNPRVFKLFWELDGKSALTLIWPPALTKLLTTRYIYIG